MFRILTKALIIKNGKILLLKRTEGSFAGGLWDIPGGKLEFGESPEESLLREVYEETSLKVHINGILSLSSGINNETQKQYITIVYLCSYISGNIVLNSEHSEYEWVDLKDVENKKMVYYVEESVNKYKNTILPV